MTVALLSACSAWLSKPYDSDNDIKNLKPKHFFMPLLLSFSRTSPLIVWCILLSTVCAALRASYFTCNVRAFFMTTSLSLDTKFFVRLHNTSHTHTHRDTEETAQKRSEMHYWQKIMLPKKPTFLSRNRSFFMWKRERIEAFSMNSKWKFYFSPSSNLRRQQKKLGTLFSFKYLQVKLTQSGKTLPLLSWHYWIKIEASN